MINTIEWKPASTAVLSNYYLMKIFQEAGMPDGVINFVSGSGAQISQVVLNHRDFGGARASGTNDKAGSHINLCRWLSPRTIKKHSFLSLISVICI